MDDKKRPYISTRRWQKAFSLLCCAAYADGRYQVDGSDLLLLRHCLFGIIPDQFSSEELLESDKKWAELLNKFLMKEVVNWCRAQRDQPSFFKTNIWLSEKERSDLNDAIQKK